ncbi:hypothetical protein DPMN_180840 [Dreissena polymorpha]|uniref:Uncharacterized protein n=1 Tax=Dreissena polymorpha TaxID=45954 RepID=A0A9D4DB72_DREPO|nr:hypothetical protein DPMN_180840 [Dreissena polymorpha]
MNLQETEMLRKVRAKRARETRRSTQGVTLEDVQQANAVLSKTDPSIVTTATTTTTSATLATTTIATTETPVATTSLTTDTTTTKSQDTSASSSRTSVLGNLNVNNDKDISSRVPVDVNIRRSQSTRETDTASMASWRKQREDPAKKDDDISATRSSSFRRIREGGSGYNLENSAYVPRNRTERAAERNALSMVDVGGPSGTGGNITRSASLRQERLRKQEEETALEQQRKEKEKEKGIVSDDLDGDRSSQDKDDKRHESTAIRRRKINRERRSTGIATYTPEVWSWRLNCPKIATCVDGVGVCATLVVLVGVISTGLSTCMMQRQKLRVKIFAHYSATFSQEKLIPPHLAPGCLQITFIHVHHVNTPVARLEFVVYNTGLAFFVQLDGKVDLGEFCCYTIGTIASLFQLRGNEEEDKDKENKEEDKTDKPSDTDDKCGNRILKSCANSLDPDETSQNVVSHQDPNCLLF